MKMRTCFVPPTHIHCFIIDRSKVGCWLGREQPALHEGALISYRYFDRNL